MESDEEGGGVYTITQPPKKNGRRRKISCLNLCVYSGSVLCIFWCTIIISAASTAIPITQLVIGNLYRDQCPINAKIPLYLIVSGATGLFLMIMQLCQGNSNIFFNFNDKTHRFRHAHKVSSALF